MIRVFAKPTREQLRRLQMTEEEYLAHMEARIAQDVEEQKAIADGRIQPRQPMHYGNDLPEPFVVRDED